MKSSQDLALKKYFNALVLMAVRHLGMTTKHTPVSAQVRRRTYESDEYT